MVLSIVTAKTTPHSAPAASPAGAGRKSTTASSSASTPWPRSAAPESTGQSVPARHARASAARTSAPAGGSPSR